MQTRNAFTTGFAASLLIIGCVNYFTFTVPYGCGRDEAGTLSMHCNSYSGLPFAMYEHHTFYHLSGYLVTGVVLNVIFALLVSFGIGWCVMKLSERFRDVKIKY